jgi:hypothetical protein
MGAVIVLAAHDDEGERILDDLEQTTGEQGERLDAGERRYALLSPAAGVDAFDKMLDEIAPDWRGHISR